jgi:glycosyltransferase involved in cell wall biosynthesis
MNRPKVSIVVPVYNVEQYIRRCLDSILSQTFTDWECILVDDGSTDDSGKICDEYTGKDKRFVVFHQENKGVAMARQKGVNEAKGEYSIHADGDDWMEHQMIDSMYQCKHSLKYTL